MKLKPNKHDPRVFGAGKIGWIFLWLIGVPIPLLLIFFVLRGCT